MKRRSLASLVLASSLTLAQLALAQSAQPLPSFSLSRFSLNEGGTAAMTAASGDTLPRFKFRATLGLHYENNPLVYYRNDERVGALVAHRLQVHLGLGFGITSWLQVTGEVPMVVLQQGDDLSMTAGTASPAGFGIGSGRLALRFGLLSQGGGGAISNAGIDLAIQVGAGLPFGSTQTLAVENGWNVVPQLSLGRTFGPVRLGAEASAHLRQSVSLTPSSARDVVGNQLGVRAVIASTNDGVRLEGSFHTLVPLEGTPPPGFEVLAGLRVPIGPIELFAIAGPGFGNLPGTPTFRAYAGIGLKPWVSACEKGQPHTPAECPDLDDDADRVRNAVDRCPLDPEDADAFEDEDGCVDPDNDADRVLDVDDRCPIEPGPRSNKGCPVRVVDSDQDGVLDVNDRCPTVPGPTSNQGCPLKDSDGDGVEDSADECPSEAGPVERKGCPLKDRDGDAVTDAEDNCPDVKGVPANQGCPEEEKQLVIITKDKLVINEKVFFATGKATILPVSFPLLTQVAQVLRNHPELASVTVEGHTDDQGSAKLNRKLSLNRAKAVKAYLEHQGIEAGRLNAQGYGPDRPADTNATEAGRANNRRVEFIIEH